jgi:hypothetical protein
MSNVTLPPASSPVSPAPAAPAKSAAPPRVPPLLLATRIARGVVVLLVVAFHLVVLAIRNPLDLWEKEITAELRERPISGQNWGAAAAADLDVKPPPSYLEDERFRDRYEKANRLSYRFVNMVGLEQDWCMFGAPLARYVTFLAVRLEFEDGTSELVFSLNEPADPTRYLRIGGYQIRKMEGYLMRPTSAELRDPKQAQFYEGYARHVLRNWRQAKPNDPRELQSIVFVRRKLRFPEPGQRHADVPPPHEDDVAAFDAQGKNGKTLP